MKEAWPKCADSYRSRSRKKKQDLDRISALERKVQVLEQQLVQLEQLLVLGKFDQQFHQRCKLELLDLVFLLQLH